MGSRQTREHARHGQGPAWGRWVQQAGETAVAKVLVTGGTGFIGPRLINELVRRGDRVRCLVRRPRRLPDGVEAVRGDMLNAPVLKEALAGVEVVYHLAGGTIVRHPIHYRRLNAQGTDLLA